MRWVIEHKEGKIHSLHTKFLSPSQLKVALSPLAWKIMQTLAEGPSYPKEIGKKLKVHEQKVYYHIRNLEKAGLIEKIREEPRQGAIAKFYNVTDYTFTLLLKPLEPSQKVFSMKSEHKKFLEPFILNGSLNALLIMGSPEPHGPLKVRAKDGPATANLALFLGSLFNYLPEKPLKIDTEVREDDLKNNLIIIGGPGVNAIANKINSKLPIRFQKIKYEGNFYNSIYSSISNKTYTEDGCGIIVKTKNPFDKTKDILVVAGKRVSGTMAATLAFIKKFDELCKGNSYNKNIFARVVEGIDKDNDGVIDDLDFLE